MDSGTKTQVISIRRENFGGLDRNSSDPYLQGLNLVILGEELLE